MDDLINHLHLGKAADVMTKLPDQSIDLIVTSPPYWSAVTYATDMSWTSYDAYLTDMMDVWQQCARVLRPNGKLCINTPIMPIPKSLIQQHTRHIKNIACDIESMILRDTSLERFSLYVWQKQTSKLMFGSYPYPGNIFENNTIEFINVYVKPGKPPRFDPAIKAANQISLEEWIDLSQQIWFMYPEDVRRADHPAPFPMKLPARLIRLYTHGATDSFAGEIVLDPFAGTGTTCVVAQSMGRQWIGIDICEQYLQSAAERLAMVCDPPLLHVGRTKYPTKDELVTERRNAGSTAEAKHKRKTYGRKMTNDAWFICSDDAR